MSLAPYVPTGYDTIIEMLKILDLGKSDTFFDLGCGLGEVLTVAATEWGLRGIGIESNPIRAKLARDSVKEFGLENQIKIIEGDISENFNYVREADGGYMYLTTYGVNKLAPLLSELKPGCRIVSKDYHIAGWDAKIKNLPGSSRLYLYTIGTL